MYKSWSFLHRQSPSQLPGYGCCRMRTRFVNPWKRHPHKEPCKFGNKMMVLYHYYCSCCYYDYSTTTATATATTTTTTTTSTTTTITTAASIIIATIIIITAITTSAAVAALSTGPAVAEGLFPGGELPRLEPGIRRAGPLGCRCR